MDDLWSMLALNWPLVRAICRAAGFAALLPTFGLLGAGLRPRLIVAVALGSLIAAGSGTMRGDEPGDMLSAAVREFISGSVLGFAVRVVVSAAQVVAQVVEQQIGLPAAEGDTAEGEPASATQRLCQLVNLTVFLSMSGHRPILAALLETAEPNGMHSESAAAAAAALLAIAWYLAIQLALPLTISLVTAYLAAGMVARVVPQMAATAVAVPLHLMFGLFLVMVSLAAISVTYSQGLDRAIRLLSGGPI